MSSDNSRVLVLFDVDGTITRRDTMFDFIKFYWGTSAFYRGMIRLLPVLVLFKLGVIPNWKAKERMLSHFFAQEPAERFQQQGDRYARQRLPKIVKESALRKIREFNERQADIYLVSASAENWLRGWSDSLGIRLIATQLDVEKGKITGKITGNNCHGHEKVARIKSEIDLSQYDQIYGYGDSPGDQPMLALTNFPHYRVFQ